MIIIPSRLNSQRLPKKALADINGLPMVVRVAQNAMKVDDTVVATDALEIVEACKKHDIKAVMTSPLHKSGTDRVNEAAKKLGLKSDDIVINLQGDEPLLEVHILKALEDRIVEALSKNENIIAASCYKLIDFNEAQDSSKVKVVVDRNGYALYFSRSMIPFDRDGEGVQHLCHLGLYGFTASSLERFCSLPHFYLEDVEKLEQLRALGSREKIAMIEVKTDSFGIDTLEDLQKALRVIR